MKKTISTAICALGMLAAPGLALADSCANSSRPPADYSGGGPLIKGHWVWLPSIGVSEDKWGFIAPGTFGTSGNYTGGQTVSLLGNSAICDGSGQAASVRQTTRGIQSGCEDTPAP